MKMQIVDLISCTPATSSPCSLISYYSKELFKYPDEKGNSIDHLLEPKTDPFPDDLSDFPINQVP
jgi:hypothetical protein